MHKNNIRFEDHELKVDFLTLNMDNSTDEKNIQKVASYVQNSFGFNCFLGEGNTNRLSRPLFHDLTNKGNTIIEIEL